MTAILSRHNRSILASKNIPAYPPYNCRRKAECPRNGNCRKKAIIYIISISTDGNDPPNCYNDCCETEFNNPDRQFCLCGSSGDITSEKKQY